LPATHDVVSQKTSRRRQAAVLQKQKPAEFVPKVACRVALSSPVTNHRVVDAIDRALPHDWLPIESENRKATGP